MRGRAGSEIKLTILRPGQTNPIEMSITREVIQLRSVRWRLEGADIGYFRVIQLTSKRQKLWGKASEKSKTRSQPTSLKATSSIFVIIQVDCSIRRSPSEMSFWEKERLYQPVAAIHKRQLVTWPSGRSR